MDSVYVNAIFTGICSFVLIDKNGPKKKAKELRFVMPNSRKWQLSTNKPKKLLPPPLPPLLPPHHPFLIARSADVAKRKTGKNKGQWLGRRPTGHLADRYVYWRLNDETLRFDYGDEKPVQKWVTLGNLSDVTNLVTVAGPDAEIDDVCVRGRSRRVATRVIFERDCVFSQRSLTTDTFVFEPGGGTTDPHELVDELQVALPAVPLQKFKNKNAAADGDDDASVSDDKNYLIITPRALDDEADDPDDEDRRIRRDIVLSPKFPLIHLYFGSAPEIDLGAVVGASPNHQHGDSNLHFEFHYGVSRKPPANPPVPVLFGKGTAGPLAGTDGCPPAGGGKP